jgi:ribosomal protein S7
MNKQQIQILKKLTNELISNGRQSYELTEIFYTICSTVTQRFSEDNNPTIKNFMQTCFTEGLKNVFT